MSTNNETVSLESLLTKVKIGQTTAFDVSKEGNLSITLRKLNPEPPVQPLRAESLARKHVFHSAEGLRDYLKMWHEDKDDSPRIVVFIDAADETVHAVLHEHADRGFEVVTMKPQLHPLWKPWQAIAGVKLSLESFAQHVDQHRRSVVQPTGVSLAFMLSQLHVAVSVRADKGRGRKSLNSLIVETSVEPGKPNQQDTLPFPDTIVVRAPLYVQTPKFDIELDLSITADSEANVSVFLSSGTVAEAKVKAFEVMCDTIVKGLEGTGAVVVFGKPEHREWKYLAPTA